MSSVILADSRLRGIEHEHSFQSFILNVKPGSQIKDHKKFVKQLLKRKSPKLFIICVGINDIPEDIKDRTRNEREKLFVKITVKFHSLVKTIKKSQNTKIIIATIPPKDLAKSVAKYPTKAAIEVDKITPAHQSEFEWFVARINNYIGDFNKTETGHHLPLHTQLRTHRSRRGSSAYRYTKFSDGLHPRESLKQTWYRKILDIHRKLHL